VKTVTKPLDEMTKDEVADIASAIFSFQHMGATTIVGVAEQCPWLVERAPCRWEMEAVLDLARRGKTVTEADDAYFDLCAKLRHRYSFETQLALWESGEPCFPLLTQAAATEIHQTEKLTDALGIDKVVLREWELGASRPDPEVERAAVSAMRRILREQWDGTALK